MERNSKFFLINLVSFLTPNILFSLSLFSLSVSLCRVRALDGSFTEAATRCGVQVVSGDYTNPDDVKFNIWSFDYSEPSLSTGCIAQLPNSRWATLDCSTSLPYACVKNEEESVSGKLVDWKVDLSVKGTASSSHCPDGYVFAAPHNGYSNSVLSVAALGQTIWLNAPNPLAT
jgi:hypothetical protein